MINVSVESPGFLRGKLYLIEGRGGVHVFNQSLKSLNRPLIIMLVAMSGYSYYCGGRGSAKSQSITSN